MHESALSEPRRPCLAAIDELLAQGDGVERTHGTEAEMVAVFQHIARRARQNRRRSIQVDGRLSDEPWREAAVLLDVRAEEASRVAAQLSVALRDALLVVLVREPNAWGSSVGEQLAHMIQQGDAPGVSLVVLRTARDSSAIAAERLEREESDLRIFYDTLAEDGWRQARALGSALDIARWWQSRPGSPAAAELDDEQLRLRARLALMRRCCPPDAWRSLGSPAARAALMEQGVVVDCGAGVQLVAPPEKQDDSQAAVAAAALEAHAADPWALARAAELREMAGDRHAAHQLALAAIRTSPDAPARSDFWRRFLATVYRHADDVALFEAATIALGWGDPDRALTLARRAMTEAQDRTELLVFSARASREGGDLQRAEVALGDALRVASDDEERADVEVELAALRLEMGNHDGSRRHAERAMALTRRLETRLAARNEIGKSLLAQRRSDEAARHFAEDEHEAACAKLRVAELRAIHNRAIALMQKTAYGEARRLLEGLADLAEPLHNVPILARAYANLTTVAIFQHDWVKAIEWDERTARQLTARGPHNTHVVYLCNMAEARMAVGQRDEAADTLRRLERLVGGVPSGPRAVLVHRRRADLAWERGDLHAAAEEIELAVAGAGRWAQAQVLDDSHLSAAGIALDAGDLQRAERHLAQVPDDAGSNVSQATMALLRLRLLAASGHLDPAQVDTALERATGTGALPQAWQVRAVAARDALAAGKVKLARRHLDAGVALREQLAAKLPDELRASFLTRRDLAELCELEQTVEGHGAHRPQRGVTLPSSPRVSGGGLVGRSRAMRTLRHAIGRIATSDATVLVMGESGTGKELVADAIHAASQRRGGPLVKVNCAALVETLLLSELFGHERGAFTGAQRQRRGRFELAQDGTIFLDEIGDISPATQVALLRVLQEKTIERVGGSEPIEVNARIMCATHRNLPRLVERGEFREDLYYRLSVLRLNVPALRERLDDLPSLCDSLLRRISAEHGLPARVLASEALAALRRHHWPGNVRELDNALRAASLFAEGKTIRVADLGRHFESLSNAASPAALRPSEGDPSDAVYALVRHSGTSLSDMKRMLERACIERAVAETEGNITKAAALLGMKRPRLSQLVNSYE